MARRAAAGCAALALAATAACTSGAAAPGPSAGPTSAASHARVVTPTRWWSNSAVRAGSTIAVRGPDSAAAALHASRAEYCGMLRQTIDAGKSILPGVGAGDPAVLATTQAFLAEIEHVAPAPLPAAWQVLGRTLITLVSSGGPAPSIDTAAVQKAEATIAADAKHGCSIDLAASGSGGSHRRK